MFATQFLKSKLPPLNANVPNERLFSAISLSLVIPPDKVIVPSTANLFIISTVPVFETFSFVDTLLMFKFELSESKISSAIKMYLSSFALRVKFPPFALIPVPSPSDVPVLLLKTNTTLSFTADIFTSLFTA